MEYFPLFIAAPPGLRLIVESDEGTEHRPLVGWGATIAQMEVPPNHALARGTGWERTAPIYVSDDGHLQSAQGMQSTVIREVPYAT